jgi:hypothetical protein
MYYTQVAGFLMQKELDYLQGAVENPQRPFAAILGIHINYIHVYTYTDITYILIHITCVHICNLYV